MSVRALVGWNGCPAIPPPERTTSGRTRYSESLEKRLTLFARLVVDVERHGRLRSGLGDQERAAARAVVRGLRVLKAAFGAIDVTHSSRAPEDVAFPARISLRRSTSASLASPRSPARAAARPAPRGGCRCVRGARGAGRRSRLLLLELADHDPKVVVGQRGQVGKWFHQSPFLVGQVSKAVTNPRGQPQLETFHSRRVPGLPRCRFQRPPSAPSLAGSTALRRQGEHDADPQDDQARSCLPRSRARSRARRTGSTSPASRETSPRASKPRGRGACSRARARDRGRGR